MNALFYFSLFVAVWFGFVNVSKVCHKRNVSAANIAIMSAAIVGCIYSILERS